MGESSPSIMPLPRRRFRTNTQAPLGAMFSPLSLGPTVLNLGVVLGQCCESYFSPPRICICTRLSVLLGRGISIGLSCIM